LLDVILKKNGFAVDVKRDTENIVSFVHSSNPDIILLDVMFPEDPQAGFKVARKYEMTPN